VSILSFRDSLNIKEGKRHAKKYAYKAFYTKKDGHEVKRLDAFDMLDVIDVPFFKKSKQLYKAMYKPTLTPFEKGLLSE
jgi:hypothetical protein